MILVVGVLNYASRLSFIALFARRTIPAGAARALKYVPAAMLTALIVPMIAGTTGTMATAPLLLRVVAAVVAGAVAFRTRSTLWTLLAGMAALWGLEAALASVR